MSVHKIASLLMALFLFPSFVWGIPKEFYGDAYDKQGNLLFREKHQVYFEGDQVEKIYTVYSNPKGHMIGYLESYFQSGPFLPNMFFKRVTDNFIARCIVRSEGDVTLLRKNPEKDFYFEKSFKRSPDMVAGHGLYFYILTLLDQAIKNGPDHPVDVLLPARLAQYPCVMSARVDSKNPDIVNVELKLSDRIKGFFVSKILVRINQKTQDLISYEGPNTLLFCEKMLCYVKINYHREKDENGES